jgi:hypothetical protein
MCPQEESKLCSFGGSGQRLGSATINNVSLATKRPCGETPESQLSPAGKGTS